VVEPADARGGAVVSWLASGQRTVASDPGDVRWIDDRLANTAWLSGADWLHLSGHLLLRAPDPSVVISAAKAARRVGVPVAVDMASAAMIQTYGVPVFRDLIASIAPRVVFGTEGEWDVVGGWSAALSPDAVVKGGRLGSTFISLGVHTSLGVVPGPVVDVTGAGDALAAGYFVGGPQRAMAAAARCVSATGAQPP
jgi:sugar/nucleoside kinase (ribokinase family)